MATLTIYLDDDTLKLVESAAKEAGGSVSGWARRHLAEAAKPASHWPVGYFEAIEAFDDSTIEEPNEVPIPLDEITL